VKIELLKGDALEVLKTLPSESIDCCITSPPYWDLRDYGVSGQLGLEKTPKEYVSKTVEVFGEVKRVLKKEGTLWLNLGDSYAGNREKSGGPGPYAQCFNTKAELCKKFNKITDGFKSKDLIGIPWRVAFALQSDGWYLRQDIIWHKPNPMPESVTDRCTKAHEYIFLLAKSQKYYFDNEAIREPLAQPTRYNHQLLNYNNPRKKEYGKSPNAINPKTLEAHRLKQLENPGRNKRSVWTVTTKPFKDAHFATFPEDLILPCVLAGCPQGGVILDPFSGAGTTGVVAKKNNRNFIGIELNPEYIKIAQRRIDNTQESLF
jgi:DNA modification methylase